MMMMTMKKIIQGVDTQNRYHDINTFHGCWYWQLLQKFFAMFEMVEYELRRWISLGLCFSKYTH